MISSLILYFQFFTRIPIPIAIEEPEAKMRAGARYFSFFGLLLGVLELLVFLLLQIFLGGGIAWVMTLFFDACITGGFHLDALSDMADGLFSSRQQERMLEIMKDSRVGSNGVLAIVFYYLIMVFSFYTLVPSVSLYQQAVIVLLLNLVGKNGICLLFYQMQYAGDNPNGLGTVFLKVKLTDILITQAVTLVVLLIFLRGAAVLCFSIHLLAVLGYRQLVLSKVGGFNGDTLGACSPVSQAVFLLSLVALRGWL